MTRPASDRDGLAAAVRDGDRRALARAITLIESTRADHQRRAEALLAELLPGTGASVRIGVSGAPGVGKSTFIEAFGLHLIGRGHRVAVLAVDPSSRRGGGALLGDKTRMTHLAQHESAFIRPSPSAGTLGGVGRRTREAILICEAAAYDVVLVETVGIGQSEAEVASMVDFFAVLLQPGAGDELQGIKKGVLELADTLVVNKADGTQLEAAKRCVGDHSRALSLLHPQSLNWTPRVLSTSALEATGIDEVWQTILEHMAALESSGERLARRREQARAWMWSLVEEGLRQSFRAHPAVADRIESLERDVQDFKTTPAAAARSLLEAFKH